MKLKNFIFSKFIKYFDENEEKIKEEIINVEKKNN
jgi:hypothetical protein